MALQGRRIARDLLPERVFFDRSPRTVGATLWKANLGSDRPNPATHRIGSKAKNIPLRRSIPFIGNEPTALAIKRGNEAIRRKIGIK